MRILLTNDDGILSAGLAAMAAVLRRLGEVCIAAPATEQSGVGQGITFLTPLTVKKAFRRGEFWGYAVEGTPVDCVKIGIAELAGGRPDLVVSGINNGLNVGINVLYSGTVAAVQESAWQGIPSVAVSTQFADLRPGARIDRVAELTGELIKRLLEHPYEPGTLYNVNVPFAALKEDADRSPLVVPIRKKVRPDPPSVLLALGPAEPEPDDADRRVDRFRRRRLGPHRRDPPAGQPDLRVSRGRNENVGPGAERRFPLFGRGRARTARFSVLPLDRPGFRRHPHRAVDAARPALRNAPKMKERENPRRVFPFFVQAEAETTIRTCRSRRKPG